MVSMMDAREEFTTALRAGQRAYRDSLAGGRYPYLQVLDDILQNSDVETTEPLGLVEIPIDRIVGTKTDGRTKAFACNFMPLLDARTEFGTKWITLCKSQMEEGIRDPIRAFEFMNLFYVQEGNKRVSVLKHFNAPSVAGYVTRLVPPRTDTHESRLYYEFLDFYKATAINSLWFSGEGRFAQLVDAAGKAQGEVWNEDDRLALTAAARRFTKAFYAAGGARVSLTPSDAMLAYIGVYGYAAFIDAVESVMRANLSKIWKEVMVMNEPEAVSLSTEPATAPRIRLTNLSKIFAPEHIKAAFLYEKTPASSGWTYAHEMGRGELEEAFEGRVATCAYENIRVGENDDETMERAIDEGAQVVFTTTPKLMAASLRAAVHHPDVKILNCSLNMTHPDIRTYYGRIHEAKFLVGAIAGALADDNRIGYVATYPTRGMTAGINAFALGAKMINPRAVIHLEWTAVKGGDIYESFARRGVSVVSNIDMRAPENSSPRFGLYRLEDGEPHNYAMPFWQWGKFYTRIIGSIFDGTWKDDDVKAGAKAVNYWWGMSAGLVDVVYSRSLPPDTARLIELLRRAICQSEFEPFEGLLRAQDGKTYGRAGERLSSEEIITMDWLAENVDGRLPDFDELVEEAKPLVKIQGVKKEKP